MTQTRIKNPPRLTQAMIDGITKESCDCQYHYPGALIGIDKNGRCSKCGRHVATAISTLIVEQELPESRWTRIRRYLDATAGPVLTVAVMIAFALGMWALFGIWQCQK